MMKRSLKLIMIIVVIFSSFATFNLLKGNAQVSTPLAQPNLQISHDLRCFVIAEGVLDGYVTITIRADTESSGVNTATAELDLVAEYTPHTPDGSHLPVVTQDLIKAIKTEYQETPAGGTPPVVTAAVSGTASISLPAHEDTNHTHEVRILDMVGTTPVQRALIHVASCES